MDGDRFDNLSRSWAASSSRRQAIRQISAGGALAGVAAALGFGRLGVVAQDDEIKICTLTVSGLTSAGPDEDDEWQGELELEIGSDGEIDAGTYTSDEGDEYDVVGRATGRAINLRIALDDDTYLSLTGTGQQDIRLCRGRIDGTFGGPEPGDTGTWTATRKTRNTSTETTPRAASTIAPTIGGTTGGGSDDPTPTPQPCPPTECSSTFTLDPVTCECVCYGNSEKCGDTMCCPRGSICDAAGGSCQCPSGSENCDDVCVSSCLAGEFYDQTCTCVPQPTELPPTVSPCPPNQNLCGGVCKDIVNDINNCGSCDNVCPIGVPCIAGSCVCAPGSVRCEGRTGCWSSCV